jgi:Zn finger protein HypA/HybF involved in hydrogenase expression
MASSIELNIIRPEAPKYLQLNVIQPSFPVVTARKKRVNRYTYDIFMELATETHGDKYDYSLIKPEDIKGYSSNVPVICKTCQYKWEPPVRAHIRGTGCPSCSGVAKWTYDRFIETATRIHENKYDYSLVNPDHIKGYESKIPVTCNACSYKWEPLLSNHIRGAGCPNCSGVARWTYERVITEAVIKHGEIYDYSEIDHHHIEGYDSKIPIICKSCNYKWCTTIGHHIRRGHGCPNCAGNAPWTYDRVIEKANYVHNTKYDYSMIKPEDIQGGGSYINVICRSCTHKWSVRIGNHINLKTGCPMCAGHFKWTYDLLMNRLIEIHGHRYDHSLIRSIHINGEQSKIPVVCKTCDYKWSPRIHDHVRGTGCPRCANIIPWNYENFIQRSLSIHCDKFDYSQVTSDMIINSHSKIPVTCRNCSHNWKVTIANHINHRTGCPRCFRTVWTLSVLMERATEIHGDLYDYSSINESDIQNTKSKVQVICKQCNHRWLVTIGSHIYSSSGCPCCRSSKGERKIMTYLNSKGITYQSQFRIVSLPTRRYDFGFYYNSKWFIIEYDGSQHFEYVPYFHVDIEDFLNDQSIDHLKTQNALQEGYCVIRIDYTQLSNIPYHIDRALEMMSHLYLSTPEMYADIIRQ